MLPSLSSAAERPAPNPVLPSVRRGRFSTIREKPIGVSCILDRDGFSMVHGLGRIAPEYDSDGHRPRPLESGDYLRIAERTCDGLLLKLVLPVIDAAGAIDSQDQGDINTRIEFLRVRSRGNGMRIAKDSR